MGKIITDFSAVSTVGLDLAKHVFQVHGVDAAGQVVVARAVRRKDIIAFFERLQLAWSGWRRVRARTTGHVN